MSEEETAPEPVQVWLADCPSCKHKIVVIAYATTSTGWLNSSQRITKFGLAEVPAEKKKESLEHQALH
jgi:hypothetical protein